MITDVVQRWRDRRDTYRPARETIDPARYEVAPISQGEAKAFVVRNHYSGSMPVPRRCDGLFRRGGLLVGVAVYSEPMQPAVLARLPCHREAARELGRFVLGEEEPANSETFFLARSFEIQRRDGAEGIVSFSDPLARTSADGATVFAGHIGTIYQAKSAVYVGQNRRHTIRLLPSGRVLSDRAQAKIRKFDRNWESAAEQLVRAGAAPLTERDDPRAWLRRWLFLTRAVRHPGNHVYLFPLTRAVRRALPPSKPYPKFLARPPR